MINQPFAWFVKTKPILNSGSIFDKFLKQNLYFYYFQLEKKDYYLFLYGEKEIGSSLDFLYQTIPVLEELNRKKRKIRSV